MLITGGRPPVNPRVRVQKLSAKVKNLKVKVSRLKKKNKILLELMAKLKNEKTMVPEIGTVLDELLANEDRNKKKLQGRRYSKKIKAFAFTLHYYSPKAYRYLRSQFSLPSPRLIKSWIHAVDCNPGFLVDIIKLIDKESGPFSLVIDSMSIRKKLVVANDKTVHGHLDLGCDFVRDEETKLATEALVFLLVPLLKRTRYPIAYFLVDKVTASLQTTLVRQCLSLTAENGLQVINITLDGCAANITTLTNLGAKIPDQPSFQHPSTDDMVSGNLLILP